MTNAGSARSFESLQDYFREASGFLAGGVNGNVRLLGGPVPLCFVMGRGSRLTDLDGNEYCMPQNVDGIVTIGPGRHPIFATA
jgi:glutamate-1-semialdehyde aminotransferase